MTPTHVVGATRVVPVDDERLLPTEGPAFTAGAALAAQHGLTTNNRPSQTTISSTLTRICFGRYDPLSTLSVMLQVNEGIQPENKHALCQLTARYLDNDGKTLVTRVFSHRLPVARNIHDFLDGMDEEVVPIVLGKEAVSRAVIGRGDTDDGADTTADAVVTDIEQLEQLAYEAQRDLDNTIHRISGAFRIIGLEEGSDSRR